MTTLTSTQKAAPAVGDVVIDLGGANGRIVAVRSDPYHPFKVRWDNDGEYDFFMHGELAWSDSFRAWCIK